MASPEWIIMWVVLAIAAVLVGLWYYWRNVRPKHTKAHGPGRGTGRAAAAARAFARANGFRFIAPARLEREGKTAALDALVVGYFGVLGVKALGYNGEVYGGAGEKTWVQVAGGQRNPFENPITQAAADVRVVRDALLAARLRQVPVEVLCVFTDPKAQLALPKNTGHFTLKTFKEQLKKDKYLEDKGLDLDKVEAALQANLAPGGPSGDA